MKLRELFTVIKPRDVFIEDCETLECLFLAGIEETYDSLVFACKSFLDCDVVDVCGGVHIDSDGFHFGCVVIAIHR